jgi:hypothetical protein
MPSTAHDLTSQPSPWRAVVEGVVAFLLLASLAGGLAAAATWGVLQAVGTLVP